MPVVRVLCRLMTSSEVSSLLSEGPSGNLTYPPEQACNRRPGRVSGEHGGLVGEPRCVRDVWMSSRVVVFVNAVGAIALVATAGAT